MRKFHRYKWRVKKTNLKNIQGKSSIDRQIMFQLLLVQAKDLRHQNSLVPKTHMIWVRLTINTLFLKTKMCQSLKCTVNEKIILSIKMNSYWFNKAKKKHCSEYKEFRLWKRNKIRRAARKAKLLSNSENSLSPTKTIPKSKKWNPTWNK